MVKSNCPEKVYRANQIAVEENGHRLLYTPPYHPELQPIELIWGQVKNAVALDPASDMAGLQSKLKVLFDGVTSTNWTKAYRKVQHYESLYRDRLDDCVLADDSDYEVIGIDIEAEHSSDEDVEVIYSI